MRKILIKASFWNIFLRVHILEKTSRIWRSRIKEHMKKMYDMKPNSFIVEHWAETHGTLTTPPTYSALSVSITNLSQDK